MIVTFYRPNAPLNLFVLPILTLLLWLPAFWQVPTTAYDSGTMPLFEWLHGFTGSLHWLESLLGILLISGQAMLLNFLVDQYQLMPRRTALPALLYVVLMSSMPELLVMHPALWAMTFVLWAFYKLLAMARSERGQSLAFDAALLIACGSLFHFPVAVLLPLVWVALNDFRPFQWREWAMPVLGFVLPYVFLGTWFFWNDALPNFIAGRIVAPMSNASMDFPASISSYALLGTMALFGLMASGAYVRTIGSNVVNIRKSLVEVVTMLLLGVGAFFMAPVANPAALALVLLPLSIILSNWLLTMRHIWLAELIVVVLIGLIIWNHVAAGGLAPA